MKRGREVNLLENYPSTVRNLDERSLGRSDESRNIARRFDKEFFDGERKNGYGGHHYNPKYWSEVVKTFQVYYGIEAKHTILDVGCAKGFMLYDFEQLIPGLTTFGLDISEYAIENRHHLLSGALCVGNAKELPFFDNSFDLVISINTIHNLELSDCMLALSEIERVSRGNSFIVVDAFRNDHEKLRMEKWNLTAKTILSTDDWKVVFETCGYSGDYYWFIP